VSPSSKARLPLVAPPEPSAKLAWSAVRNGATYRVAMDYNVTQANLLLSAAFDEAGIRATSHEVSGLNVGRYFWRVSAVNRDGLEGAPSRVAFFSVVEPEAPSPAATPTPGSERLTLTLQSLDEIAPGIVHVGGRTLAGATVTVNGKAVKVLPDGSFSEYVKHSGPAQVVVRATGPDGRFTEQARGVAKR
jgi:hypothetical protein